MTPTFAVGKDEKSGRKATTSSTVARKPHGGPAWARCRPTGDPRCGRARHAQRHRDSLHLRLLDGSGADGGRCGEHVRNWPSRRIVGAGPDAALLARSVPFARGAAVP